MNSVTYSRFVAEKSAIFVTGTPSYSSGITIFVTVDLLGTLLTIASPSLISYLMAASLPLKREVTDSQPEKMKQTQRISALRETIYLLILLSPHFHFLQWL